jgi:hypothetical protein
MGSRDKGKKEVKKQKKDRLVKITAPQEAVPTVEVVKRPRKTRDEDLDENE